MKTKLAIYIALILGFLLCACSNERDGINREANEEKTVSEETESTELNYSENEKVSKDEKEIKNNDTLEPKEENCKYVPISKKMWMYNNTNGEPILLQDDEYDQKGNPLKRLFLSFDNYYELYNYVYDSTGNPEYATIYRQTVGDDTIDELGSISFINEYNMETGSLIRRTYISLDGNEITEEFDTDGALISSCRKYIDGNTYTSIDEDSYEYGIQVYQDVYELNERCDVIHYTRYSVEGNKIGEEIYEYDGHGELVHRIFIVGEETTEECNYALNYEFDTDGKKIRSVSIDDKGNETTSSYEYDSFGNYSVKKEIYSDDIINSDEKINFEVELKYAKLQ